MEDALFASLTIVVGLIVLLAAYALIPLCIAFLSKTPIAKKLYSTVCVANTALVCLIITTAAYSDEPFFSITLAIACGYAAYRIGVSRLKKKNLLLEKEPKAKKQGTAYDGAIRNDVTLRSPVEEKAPVEEKPPVEYEQLEISVEPHLDDKPMPEPTPEQKVEKSGKTALFVLISAVLVVAALAGGYYWGMQEGYDTGSEAGYDDGYDIGYLDGHSVGYKSGKTAGYNSGFSVGYTAGKASKKVSVTSSSSSPTVTYNPNVCISDGGYSYHYGWCPYLGEKEVVSLSYAKAAGYTRCANCNPPA